MKKSFLPFVSGVLALLIFSCGFFADDPASDFLTDPSYGTHWAQNMATGRFYRVNAELLAEGARCKIWVEKNSGVNADAARAMAAVFDNDIYGKMMETFGVVADVETPGGTRAMNTMEAADEAFGDNDGKLCILLLDIKDGYRNRNDSYTAGYFWAGNFFANNPDHSYFKYSNARDMIYVDTYPGVPGSPDSNETLAHEMQHLMNYIASNLIRGGSAMDLWIDEGLAGAAQWVYSGTHSQLRLQWFHNDPTRLISQGNNFFVWGNYTQISDYAEQDDYATVYLFFQWLRLQAADPSGLYKGIISSPRRDWRAVADSVGYAAWEPLFGDWLAANYINAPSGRYGYLNEAGPGTLNNLGLRDIRAKTMPQEMQGDYSGGYPLAPGEAVYSILKSDRMPSPSGGSDIRYLSLAKSGSADADARANEALLTFNSNSNANAASQYQDGEITGYGDPADWNGRSAASASASGFRSAVPPSAAPAGPFPVSAGDTLRRNGRDEIRPGFGTPRFSGGANR